MPTKTQISSIELPKDSIISMVWGEENTRTYLKSLPKNSVFGYSAAFSQDSITDLIEGLGMKASLFPEKHPLRKKYGKYILKVVTPYRDPHQDRLVRTWVGNVHHYERTAARGTRKCKGPGCNHTINKGDLCLEVYELALTPRGQTCYKKTTLCVDCAIRHVKVGIETLIDVLPLNIPKSSITISFNPKIQLSRAIQ